MSSHSIRGLLTEQERQFLRGEAEDVSNPRKIRHQIRQRTKTALEDLALIAQHLEERDYAQLYDVDTEAFPPDARESIHGTVAFLYKLAAITGVNAESIFWHGIHQGHAETYPNRVADVDLAIQSEPEEAILESLSEKLESDTRLTDIELRTLYRNPHVRPRETTTADTGGMHPTTDSLTRRLHELLTDREVDVDVVTATYQELPSPIPRPYLVLRRADDSLTLIETLTDVTDPDDIQETIEHLSAAAVKYGGTAGVRKLIVTLHGNDSPSDEPGHVNGHVFEIDAGNTVLSTNPFSSEAELLDLVLSTRSS